MCACESICTCLCPQDLIVGCSSGAVLALGLSVLDHDCDDGLDMFLELGASAFIPSAQRESSIAKRVRIRSDVVRRDKER
eukprot:m.688893 g.688893  ORF g.688893 m.688893 type:complete len:80 (+) comp22845_c0_seq70:158-397(+)